MIITRVKKVKGTAEFTSESFSMTLTDTDLEDPGILRRAKRLSGITEVCVAACMFEQTLLTEREFKQIVKRNEKHIKDMKNGSASNAT